MDRGVVAKLLATIVLSLSATTAQAVVAWNESGNGDLSGNRLSPTPIVMTSGSNKIIGTTGNGGSGVDRDYFRFTVPPGATLSAIRLDDVSVSGSVSFIGIQPGPQMTVEETGSGSEALIARGHYNNDQFGTDIWPSIKLGTPGPLLAGTYTVWVQETGGPASYAFDFVISGGSGPATASVPTLPQWGMLLLAVLLAGAYWRQRRKGINP